jgi:hypothetical protein
MEEIMTAFRTTCRGLWLAFAAALAAPAPALAHDGGVRPVHHHRSIHYRVVHAEPSAPAFEFRSASYLPPRVLLRTEGLGRNPDDCARHGCVANN